MAMTPEERRAKDADRKRKARARAAATKAAVANKTRTPKSSAETRTMRDAVDEALAAMKWLVASDVASVMQAKELAREIDELSAEGERTKALSAHRALSRVLSDLGGTPNMRMQRELRSLKHAPPPGGEDERPDSPSEGGAVVTQLKRPPKRRA